MRYGWKSKQRGATFLGIVVIVGILGFAVYAGIRLAPKYMEYMAVARALDQVAKNMQGGGDASPAAIRDLLGRRWEIEDIKSLDIKDVEINKVANGTEVRAAYRAEAPFVGNVSLVVDFDKAVVIGGGGG